MNRLERALREIAGFLNACDQGWALVGGLAVSARCEPRFTRDIDLALAVTSDSEAEALVQQLLQRGYSLHALVEQEAAQRLATARLLPPGESDDGVVIDLLFASSGIEVEVVEAAEIVNLLPRLPIPIASGAHLLALKLLSADDRRRPQDRIDIYALVSQLDNKQLDAARLAVSLIEQRGFNRARNLTRSLEELLEQTE